MSLGRPFMPCNCNSCQRLDGRLSSRREAHWTSVGTTPGTGLLRPVTIEAASRGDEATPGFYRATGVRTSLLEGSIERLRDAEFAGHRAQKLRAILEKRGPAFFAGKARRERRQQLDADWIQLLAFTPLGFS